jgi:transcriptional regulator with XRE-family HTH domain
MPPSNEQKRKKRGQTPSVLKIRQLREAKGWSPRDLAKYSRTSEKTILAMEEGEPKDWSSFRKVAGALGVEASDLLAPSIISLAEQIRPVDTRNYTISVLRSGRLAYVRDIYRSLVLTLPVLLASASRPISFIENDGPENGYESNRSEWNSRASALVTKSGGPIGPDMYVAIGTHAALALKECLGKNFGLKPFIFLGVTDPIRSGLVTTEYDRNDNNQVAGVSYGAGLLKSVDIASRTFPDRRLEFVYWAQIEADVHMAALLERSPFFRTGRLSVRGINHAPTILDFPDSNAVYMSWFTLEMLLETAEGLEICNERLIIPGTPGNALNGRYTIADISPDDEEIGVQGSEIIASYLMRGIKLGQIPVTCPSYRLWLHPTLARERWQIEFPKEMLQLASETGAVF